MATDRSGDVGQLQPPADQLTTSDFKKQLYVQLKNNGVVNHLKVRPVPAFERPP